jgi:hypothetical protein
MMNPTARAAKGIAQPNNPKPSGNGSVRNSAGLDRFANFGIDLFAKTAMQHVAVGDRVGTPALALAAQLITHRAHIEEHLISGRHGLRHGRAAQGERGRQQGRKASFS